LQVPKLCRDLDWTLFCILKYWPYSKFVSWNKMLMFTVCLTQICSSAGRRFVASKSRLQYYRLGRIFSFSQQKFRWNAARRCKLNSTANLRSFQLHQIWGQTFCKVVFLTDMHVWKCVIQVININKYKAKPWRRHVQYEIKNRNRCSWWHKTSSEVTSF